jgi:hypothetical protein
MISLMSTNSSWKGSVTIVSIRADLELCVSDSM